jgi:hypothetical protein
MWERVSALWALSKADLPAIKENLALIRGYLHNDEWWLRVAAWAALSPLNKDPATLKTILPELLACYAKELHTFPNRQMMGRLKQMHTTIPELRAEIIAGMAAAANKQPIEQGFQQPVYVNKMFEPLRFIDMQNHPEHAIQMLPAARRLMKNMDGLFVIWLFTGDRWGNAGLVNSANALGEKAKPLIAGFKAMRPDLEAKAKVPGRDKAKLEDVLKKVDKCIADYEAKYGKVEAAKPPVEPAG